MSEVAARSCLVARSDTAGTEYRTIAGRRRRYCARSSRPRPAVLVAFCETKGHASGFSPLLPPAHHPERGKRGGPRVLRATRQNGPRAARRRAVRVEARTNRRTALVALRGELDLLTVSKFAEVLDGLEPQADGVRHVVLDLRGLTFMDLTGLHELIRQNEFARSNRHNLAVVRGTDAIQRVLELTGVEEMLVLVDDPDDLVPPPVTH